MKDDRYSIHAPKVSGVVLSRSLIQDFTEYKELGFSRPPSIVGVVSSSSTRSLRKAATAIATYFQREFHYDFVQFSQTSDGSHDKDRAFLYSHSPYLGKLRQLTSVPLVGCCSFRWREDADRPCYALQWIWFHPYFRRKGLLADSWGYFKARFGEFCIEQPISPAMTSFLESRAREQPKSAHAEGLGMHHQDQAFMTREVDSKANEQKKRKLPDYSTKPPKRRIVFVKGVNPLQISKRVPEKLEVGAEAWVSFDGRKALPVVVTEFDEDGRHCGVRFERPSRSEGVSLADTRGMTTHILFLDEVRSTPEVACVNRVTL